MASVKGMSLVARFSKRDLFHVGAISLGLCLLPCGEICAVASARLQQTADGLASTRAYGITELRRIFEQATMPRGDALVGRWVMIRHVMTERFIRGRNGPDHIIFDIQGIRSGGGPTNPLEWVLTLRGMPLVARERDISSVGFNSAGELIFAKDYAGDSLWFYRCRLVNTQRLVCLMKDHEDGHGVEFFRSAD